MRFKPPKFLRRLMPALVWDIPEERDVFLTFDDGPTPGVTEWILDELARHDARATFFCLGRNVENHPELYRRILEEGHRVGNHTYGHVKGWERDDASYLADVERAARVIDSPLFRPPYGRISPRQARALSGEGWKIVMWNVVSRDYSRRVTPERCIENVVRHVRPGDIVVFHDSEKAFRNLRAALPATLECLDECGMRSKSIER
ncbi:MAG: polysaccharide deacetylase family protein [Alistipes sp.]|nr:polysaccharide deacetylase family protein [Alistipes sp.]